MEVPQTVLCLIELLKSKCKMQYLQSEASFSRCFCRAVSVSSWRAVNSPWTSSILDTECLAFLQDCSEHLKLKNLHQNARHHFNNFILSSQMNWDMVLTTYYAVVLKQQSWRGNLLDTQSYETSPTILPWFGSRPGGTLVRHSPRNAFLLFDELVFAMTCNLQQELGWFVAKCETT